MVLLVQGNALRIPLVDESVHCVITSPPYFGLRDYGIERQLGLEPTPEEYVDNMVHAFGEVRRVLRNDGTVWLNLGDSYASGGRGSSRYHRQKMGEGTAQAPALGRKVAPDGLKDKDLVGIPWRVAFALQADGWYLRSDVIWAKGVSFCDSYSGSVMPESVNGWRWEKHRVKVASESRPQIGGKVFRSGVRYIEQGTLPDNSIANKHRLEPIHADCPGCPKCAPNDGYVLRRGSWRPTKAHEYVFMLAKSADYFCDAEAVKEDCSPNTAPGAKISSIYVGRNAATQTGGKETSALGMGWNADRGRNPRTVWTINPQPYSGAHYACFPPALVEPCIKAGTSERGVCPVCGAPWARVVEKSPGWDGAKYGERAVNATGGAISGGTEQSTLGSSNGKLTGKSNTIDWRPTCNHSAEPVPAIVLDPFVGSGTTLQVARALGRRSIGLDLSATYLCDNARARLEIDKLDAWQHGISTDDNENSLNDLPLFSDL